MLSPVRWFLILLIALVLTFGAIWWWMEAIADYAVRGQLAKLEVELVDLQMERIDPGGLEVPSLALRGPDMVVTVSGLHLQPLPDREFQVQIERLLVELSGTDDSPKEPSIDELWQQLQAVIPMLPARGTISELVFCQNSICETASLAWQRSDQNISVDALLRNNGIQLHADISDSIETEIVSSMQSQPAVSQLRIEPKVDLFTVSASGYALPDLDLELLQVVGLAGNLRSLDVTLEAKLKGTEVLSEIQNTLIANGRVKSQIDWQYEQEDLRLSSTGEHVVGFVFSDLLASVTLESNPDVSVAFEDLVTANLSFSGENICDVELLSSNIRCRTDLAAFSVEAEDVVADVAFKNFLVEQVDELVSLNGQLSVSAFDLQSGAEFLSGPANFSLLDQSIEFSANELSVWGQTTNIAVTHRLDTGIGAFDLNLTGPLNRLGDALHFVSGTDAAELFDELNGRVNVTSVGGWERSLEDGVAVQQQSQISLSDVTVDYDGYVVQGGVMQAELAGWPELAGSVDLMLKSVAAGLLAEDIQASFSISADTATGSGSIEGKSLSLAMLGGKVDSQQYSYDYASNNGTAVLKVEKLQLAELLALQRQDFSCEGTLSGSVPVQLIAGNVSVEGATIAAEAPGGFIRYVPEDSVRAMGQDNEGLLVVLDAMRNFQYHTLLATVDYSEAGQMIARTSLKGANPNYQGGREVHLNLTLEENLKTLLESLRLGADVAEKVGKKSARGS